MKLVAYCSITWKSEECAHVNYRGAAGQDNELRDGTGTRIDFVRREDTKGPKVADNPGLVRIRPSVVNSDVMIVP